MLAICPSNVQEPRGVMKEKNKLKKKQFQGTIFENEQNPSDLHHLPFSIT